MTRRPLPQAAPPAPIDLNPREEPVLDFPDRELGELTAADYQELGFLCGLEVHQQLATEKKLFCRCPAGRRTSQVDMEVLRHMRPTLSEMGLYDGTALMEFKTQKEIVYLLERETTCTYEIDDTPPFPINEEALKIALEISMLFGLNIASELQVMRKQYLDGSIPTGFQRTAMVGLGGSVPLRGSELGQSHELRIRQLTIEEDSCREVSDLGHRILFRTDRLGTPLIETVTEPDLLTPRDVELGGRLLARVAQASGKLRRGAGAGRQDVNVSIAGSRRIELKGVCQHKGLPLLVHNEAYRQLNLLRLREELRKRGIRSEMLTASETETILESPLCVDAAPALRDSNHGPVREALIRGDVAWAVRLPGFGGLLSRRTQPGRTFAHELAGRLRVIACLVARPCMAHSDEADGLGSLGPAAWRELHAQLKADAEDAIVVTWGPQQDLETAAREILLRGSDALVGVPSETRQTFRDATTGFERILPGPERMYPDTDTPPIAVPDDWLQEIQMRLPERPWEREERYRRSGLSERAAALLSEAPWADLFDALGPRTEATARRLAAAFEKRLVHHWRATGRRALPEADRLRPLVLATDDNKLRPEAFERVFDRLLNEPQRTPDELLAEYLPVGGDETELERRIEALSSEKPALAGDVLVRWGMGALMRRFRGRLDPAVVRERLRLVFDPSSSSAEVSS